MGFLAFLLPVLVVKGLSAQVEISLTKGTQAYLQVLLTPLLFLVCTKAG